MSKENDYFIDISKHQAKISLIMLLVYFLFILRRSFLLMIVMQAILKNIYNTFYIKIKEKCDIVMSLGGLFYSILVAGVAPVCGGREDVPTLSYKSPVPPTFKYHSMV